MFLHRKAVVWSARRKNQSRWAINRVGKLPTGKRQKNHSSASHDCGQMVSPNGKQLLVANHQMIRFLWLIWTQRK